MPIPAIESKSIVAEKPPNELEDAMGFWGGGCGTGLVGAMLCAVGSGDAAAQETLPAQDGVAQTTPITKGGSSDLGSGGGTLEAAAPTATGGEGQVQIYPRSFFDPYKPQNAEDMLRRVPGVAAILDTATAGATTQARGLGSGGDQILIGGRRLAAKNQIVQMLRRLSAASVERVELIRGTSEGIEVLSEGLIVNIVMVPGKSNSGGSGNLEANFRFGDQGYAALDGLLSYSGSFGQFSYTFGAERNAWTPIGLTPTGGTNDWSRRFRDEIYYYPDGSVQEKRPQRWSRSHNKAIYTTNLGYDWGGGDQIKFNALYQPLRVLEIDETPFIRYASNGSTGAMGDELHQRDNRAKLLDLGADFQKRLLGGSLNVILIRTRTEQDLTDVRNRQIGARYVEVGKSVSSQNKGEDIIRASYSRALNSGMDLTVGVEGAKNFLDQQLDTFFDTDGDDRLELIPFPESFADIREKRGEIFAIHSWKLTSELSMETSLNYEVSSISTNFSFVPQHTYRFFKPRLDVRYNLTPQDLFRFKVERTISQLDFQNFIPIYNPVDNRVDAGNAEIQPEKTWIFEAAYERRLLGDNGSIEVRLFYRDISDHISRGPFAISSGGRITSAPINIDKARHYGGEIKGAIRLDMIGLRDAQINARYVRQFSNVIDPFTSLNRKMKDPYDSEFNIGYRQDLTRLGMAFGANYIDTSGDQITSDVRNVEYFSRGPRVDAFVEKSLPAGFTVRFEAHNINRSPEYKSRDLFVDSQSEGTLLRREYYRERRERRYALKLRKSF
ncbi:TonB-dependent receptor plug domain-containing protein [Sphingopyxis witflariensis]|uniref:TonB-dependent receptor plug domain-containing protein n=1 Tax=Sphingopyxis witflariensis TaxID=173675 RepID=UPI001303DA7D|nr:TonB-dependent receptor [Sphingopyxis witflariensis]